LAGTVLTALGIAVLVIAVVALQHPNGPAAASATTTSAHPATHPSSAPSRTPTTSATGPGPTTSARTAASTGKLPLVVLNNTTSTGLAEQARATFEAGGWTVTSVGNLTNNILSTCAYYDPAYPGAQAAAAALRAQFPAIKRTVAKFAGLPAGPVVVVLTSDYPTG
jgi:hypothetical protein